MRNLLVLLILIFFYSCSHKTNKVEVKSIAQKKDKTSSKIKNSIQPKEWTNEYNSYIEKYIKDFKFHQKYKKQVTCWSMFYKAVAFAESGNNRFDTYWEKNLGKPKGYDRNTKMKYMSEGFFQLSYSDANYYKCEFDIEGDRNKKSDDITKTIFDAKKNIRCAIVIMEKQLKLRKNIISRKSYWSVLRPGRKSNDNFNYYYKKFKNKCE